MKRIWVTFAALALAACAGSRGARESTAGMQVADEDIGRLDPTQVAPVEQARQFRGSARDEQARARLRLQQAQHELEVAKADQKEADADAGSAEVQAKMANESREPAQLERARQLKDQAQLRKSMADAHIEYAHQLVQARQASADAADKQVALGDARLEQAKLQALQQANIAAYTKYDASKYRQQVSDAQKSFDDALKKARDLDAQATGSQRRFEDLKRQVEARGSAVQTG